ncbi:MAG: hypothetical protein QOK08_620 [Actinomycetota bacterium]|jgi:hypothetical protein|nr:hypothetical protein [Actinomycetota bacterium]
MIARSLNRGGLNRRQRKRRRVQRDARRRRRVGSAGRGRRAVRGSAWRGTVAHGRLLRRLRGCRPTGFRRRGSGGQSLRRSGWLLETRTRQDRRSDRGIERIVEHVRIIELWLLQHGSAREPGKCAEVGRKGQPGLIRPVRDGNWAGCRLGGCLGRRRLSRRRSRSRRRGWLAGRGRWGRGWRSCRGRWSGRHRDNRRYRLGDNDIRRPVLSIPASQTRHVCRVRVPPGRNRRTVADSHPKPPMPKTRVGLFECMSAEADGAIGVQRRIPSNSQVTHGRTDQDCCCRVDLNETLSSNHKSSPQSAEHI